MLSTQPGHLPISLTDDVRRTLTICHRNAEPLALHFIRALNRSSGDSPDPLTSLKRQTPSCWHSLGVELRPEHRSLETKSISAITIIIDYEHFSSATQTLETKAGAGVRKKK